jgi:hypothetical protein
MSVLNQTDTSIAAPKAPKDYIRLDPFPSDGPQILTITGWNVIPDYINPFSDEPDPKPYQAVELIYGTNTEVGPRFVKGNPVKVSIHEKSSFSRIYKAALGKMPADGAKIGDLLGKGVSANVTNENKVSKKGTAYVRTSIKDIASVHPKLAKEIIPLAALKPALEAALAKSGEKAEGTPSGDDNSAPF